MNGTQGGVSPALRATALSLRLDALAAEMVSRFREAGIRSILLKGPSIARWLYADGAPRPYVDIDLLVAPDAIAEARRVLRGAGFRRGQPGWQEVSYSWRRPSDSAAVDLHRSLFGVGCSPEASWVILSARTESMSVGGVDVEVLTPPALALHVALHATQHGAGEIQTISDLDRALAIGGERCWGEAARLARRLDAVPAFAAGLRLHPVGVELAEALRLPDRRPAEVALHADGAPPLALGLEQLVIAEGFGARARFVVRKLAPSPTYMRRTSSLARRGSLGLALAYLWRPLWILLKSPAGLAAWWRVRRTTAIGRSDL